MHSRFALRWVTSLSALLALSGWLACSSGSDDDDDDDACSSDNDCKGDRICEDGECVDPGSTSTGTPSGSSGSGGQCVPSGGECSTTACCDGSACVDAGDAGMRCGALCTSNDQCQSDCCGAVSGQNVCAPAAYCTGSDPICAGECIDDPGCYTEPPFPQSSDCLGCVQGAANSLAQCAIDAAFSSECTGSTSCSIFVNCINNGNTVATCANENPAGYSFIENIVIRYCGCGF